MGESTEAVGNSVLHELALSEIFMLQDLEELCGKLCHHGAVLSDARVVHEIAPETQHVEQLFFCELSEALKLVGPVCF